MWCWGMSILIRSDKKVKFEYEKRNQQPIHPIHTVTSIFWNLEKTLILEKTEGGRRRGRQRMRWLDGITDSMDMSLGNGSEVKVSASNAEDPGSVPGLGRSPGEGNGNVLHYSCLENPMDGGAW